MSAGKLVLYAVAVVLSMWDKRPFTCFPCHRKVKVVRVTVLVFTGDVEACLQRLQWIPGLSSWRPFRFSGFPGMSTIPAISMLRNYRKFKCICMFLKNKSARILSSSTLKNNRCRSHTQTITRRAEHSLSINIPDLYFYVWWLWYLQCIIAMEILQSCTKPSLIARFMGPTGPR